MTDGTHRVVVHSFVYEFDQVAVGTDNAECAVPGIDEHARRGHDALEHISQLEITRKGGQRVKKSLFGSLLIVHRPRTLCGQEAVDIRTFAPAALRTSNEIIDTERRLP
jgi:hypothetical protein